MAMRDYASFQKQILGYQAEDRLDSDHVCFVIDDAVEQLKLGEAAKRQFEGWTSDSACMDELERRLSSFGVRDDGVERDVDDLRALVRKYE